MTKINITIESTGMTPVQANLFSTFLGSLKEETIQIPEAPQIEAPISEKPKGVKTRLTKKEVVEAVAEAEAENFQKEEQAEKVNNIEVEAPEVVEPTEEIQEEESEVSTIKIEDIRKLVAEKQAMHKDLLRAKLKEYGAANVTALPTQHYEDFHALLIGLK